MLNGDPENVATNANTQNQGVYFLDTDGVEGGRTAHERAASRQDRTRGPLPEGEGQCVIGGRNPVENGWDADHDAGATHGGSFGKPLALQ